MDSMTEEMFRQSQGMSPENFVCKSCKYYNGAMKCKKNVFIAFVGANMSGCQFYGYEYLCHGIQCPHRGRNF